MLPFLDKTCREIAFISWRQKYPIKVCKVKVDISLIIDTIDFVFWTGD